jgi:hypothetical protein
MNVAQSVDTQPLLVNIRSADLHDRSRSVAYGESVRRYPG